FERQWLFYKLWGRLLYNPDTPDDVFRKAFEQRYGPETRTLLDAYALSSATALRLASSRDIRWDFTLYSEGFLSLNENFDDYESSTMDYISVDRMIKHPPLDPSYVSIQEYVEYTLEGRSFEAHRMTPPKLAAKLKEDNHKALELVRDIDVTGNATLLYEVSDVQTWAYLGLHFAEKIKGGMALHTFRLTGNEEQKEIAVQHMEKALEYWDRVVEVTRPLYKDMHLTHHMGGSFERDDEILFHWEHVRPEVAADIEVARNAVPY
ncbi:hypothetical protein QLX67_13820, partial [Balneolaceae bacterium ANBcel3]|nr:hypothetical protein [Balneolaceae bacterium ANBcel3]